MQKKNWHKILVIYYKIRTKGLEIKMKKIFSLIAIAVILSLGCNYNSTLANTPQKQNCPSKEQLKRDFEKRLNLSDKQKEKAKAIHQEGREQMRPIIMQIQAKRQEIDAIKRSKLAERAQQERISQLEEEIAGLNKQAREIRKKNTQDFEKILNKKQKAELEKMKAEGRARFERQHPPRPPFNGLGTPGFLMPRPLFPQLTPNQDF